jgi:hypothetical protein
LGDFDIPFISPGYAKTEHFIVDAVKREKSNQFKPQVSATVIGNGGSVDGVGTTTTKESNEQRYISRDGTIETKDHGSSHRKLFW